VITTLRRLLRRPTTVPPPVTPRGSDTVWLDLRPSEALATCLVDGAWVLTPAEALALATRLPAGMTVIGASPAETTRWVEALRAAGCAAVAGDPIGVLRAAGVPTHEPAWKSPLPPGHPVTLAEGDGWVQDVRWVDTEFRFDVLVDVPGALVRREGLPEETLRSRGPRGAAGLGRVG
jgi:hypothetical protein